MRVFHVISGFENGGVEALLFRWIAAMPQDVEFHIVAHDETVPACAARFRTLGVKVHLIPCRKQYRKHKKALLQLFLEYRPDVVHVHTSEWGIVALVAARRAGVPCRIQHTHAAMRTKNPLRALLYRFNFWRAAQVATDLVACGEGAALASFGKRLCRTEHVTVLKNGVDISHYAFSEARRTAARAALDIKDDTVIVGMVARFSPQKNHVTALKIFAAYHQKHPKTVLLLVGEGRLRAKIERMAARLLPAGTVRFLGVREDVPALLAAMDRFILPSRFEGMPLTLVEAVTAGLLPVVSDRISQEASFAGVVRFLPLGNINAWCAALEAAIPAKREEAEKLVTGAGYAVHDTAAVLAALYGKHQ